MAQSSINGRAVPLTAAVAEAARLIAASRAVVIGGLGTDVAGARAAILLADRCGASIDHMHSTALLRDLDVMREHGLMLTTPSEARRRADVVFLVGSGLTPGLAEIWPDLKVPVLRLGGEALGAPRVLGLCSDKPGLGHMLDVALDGGADELPSLLGALQARLVGRPVAVPAETVSGLDSLATALAAARFGVAVWSAAHLDTLAIEMLCGLIKDLNTKTRFTGLPLEPGDNAVGVLQACGWMTGFPMRTGFARGFAEHDPWRFEAKRLLASGEADCGLWISAYRAEPPEWPSDIPLIALAAPATSFDAAPQVQIAVGRPGVDHAGVEHFARTGTLSPVGAAQASDMPSVAAILSLIVQALEAEGRRPC